MKTTVLSFLLFALTGSFTTYAQEQPRDRSRKPLKVLVISDLNSSYGSTTYSKEVTAVIGQLDSIRPDIILCAGDMVAGQKKSLTEEQIRSMWSGFERDVLTPVSTLKIPFGFTVGNHDASPSYQLDRSLAERFWKEQAARTNLEFVDSTHYPFYYSYRKGHAFFISWDAAGSQVPEEVYAWMEKQLNSKAARNARVRILLGHLPLYPIVESKNRPGEVIASADAALKFMNDHRIDLYISGHQHAYFPAFKGGVRLLNAGAIGDGPRKIMGHAAEPKKAFTVFEIPYRKAKKFAYHTLVPVTGEVIETESLPENVTGINGTLNREK